MKNLKMILAVFLCAVIVCGAMPQFAFAATSGTCGENVTWELSGTTLTIIGTGDMYDYESSGTNASPWLSNSSIKKVVIEDGVTSIGDYSFYKCSALTSASLADTLESIGSHAFASTVLSSIDIPDGVVSIGQWAFYSTDLIEMVIPDSVTDIGAYAFYYCDSLGEVTLSKNLTVINKYTFAYCKWLSFIDIPAKVGAISDYAFYGCSFMTSVFLPTKVANGGIGESAFAGCGNLKNVYFAGGEEDREAISIGSLNQCLTNATWYYYSPLAAVDEESSDISTYCTVTFDGRGVCEVEPQVVEQYDLAVEPDVDMSREGYTFLGWYNGSSKYDFSSFVTSDITLTAKWEDEEIPSYSSGGGYYYYTEAADDGIHLYRICYVGHTNSLVATASYSSVTSSVWTVPANVTYETSGVTCIATAQKAGRYTIYDTITSGYYVIAYDANNKPYNQWLGGVNICYFYLHAVEEISNIMVDSGINMNVGQSVPLNYTTTPSGGYARAINGFLWYSSNTDVVTISDDGILTAVGEGTATITLATTSTNPQKATCVVNVGEGETYSVIYDANGGSGAPGSQTKSQSIILTLSSGVPTRSGYTFTGWNTSSDGSGTNYSPGGEYSKDADVTLYAQWTKVTYTVTYDANGGSGAPGSQTKTYGTSLTLSDTIPTRTGYTFTGWNTSSDGSGTSYAAGGAYTENAAATLYAQWEKKTDSIFTASVAFNQESLTAGELTAACAVVESFSDDLFISLNFYRSDGLIEDFVVQRVTPSQSRDYYISQLSLTLTIPDDVSDGDYIKVVIISAETLEPATFTNDNTLSACEVRYDGLSERYYTLDSPDGSIALTSLTGSANRDLIVADEGSVFRLKDMGEGEYAFENGDKSSDRLKQNTDTSPRMGVYLPGSATQRWLLAEYDGGYSIQSVSNSKYIAIADGEVILSEEPYAFTLTLCGETPFSLATALDGFALLTEAQQTRYVEIFTSVGASVFPDAGNQTTFLSRSETELTTLYSEKDSLTAEEQRDQLLEIMSSPIYYSSTTSYTCDIRNIPTLPDTDVTITQSDPVATQHEIWDLCSSGETVDCYLIAVTYTTDDSTQTVSVYTPDTTFGNVQNAIEALGRFPYAYRQYIKNMYVYQSDGNTYNCGGEEMFVRLSQAVSVDSIARGFAHELGHSLDMMANGNVSDTTTHWCQGSKWQSCVADDIATISVYGNSNYYEGIAEFSRLYLSSYDNRDRMLGMEQLFPNQLASFNRLLTKVGASVLYGGTE